MFYKLSIKLKCLTSARNIDKKYYTILGGFLGLFKKYKSIYANLLALSPLIKDENDYKIFFSFYGNKKVLFSVLNEFLIEEKSISLDGIRFQVKEIDILKNSELDISKIGFKPIEKFTLHFQTPTFFSNHGKSVYEYQAWRVLNSVKNKYQKLGGNIELDKKIMGKIGVTGYDIRTQRVLLKNTFKTGFVGKVYYFVPELGEEIFYRDLYLLLRLVPYTGVGTSAKLGCGNVHILFK